jgi:hypothetical protein
MLGFEIEGKKWYTNTYSSLKIGENLFNGKIDNPTDWDIFEDYISDALEKFFNENNFIIDAN